MTQSNKIDFKCNNCNFDKSTSITENLKISIATLEIRICLTCQDFIIMKTSEIFDNDYDSIYYNPFGSGEIKAKNGPICEVCNTNNNLPLTDLLSCGCPKCESKLFTIKTN